MHLQIKYLSVQLYSQYRVGVAVVTYFCFFFEMADFELTGRSQTDDSNQTAGEKTGYYTCLLLNFYKISKI